jgi:hypothetical protein
MYRVLPSANNEVQSCILVKKYSEVHDDDAHEFLSENVYLGPGKLILTYSIHSLWHLFTLILRSKKNSIIGSQTD